MSMNYCNNRFSLGYIETHRIIYLTLVITLLVWINSHIQSYCLFCVKLLMIEVHHDNVVLLTLIVFIVNTLRICRCVELLHMT